MRANIDGPSLNSCFPYNVMYLNASPDHPPVFPHSSMRLKILVLIQQPVDGLRPSGSTLIAHHQFVIIFPSSPLVISKWNHVHTLKLQCAAQQNSQHFLLDECCER